MRSIFANVVDTKQETKELKDVPVVCQIHDVFFDDLLGIPPKREVEI